MNYDLQFFGGRGASGDSGAKLRIKVKNSAWSGALGDANTTLKEALGSKGKPKTIGDSIVKTNPNYNQSYREFTENCQRCVVAYEARRRGYDVEARPTYEGDRLPNVAYSDNNANISRGRWMGAFQGAKPKDVSAKTESGVMKNIDKQMSNYGEGSRGVVQIFYKGGGGHVFNVERKNGKTLYVEAQSGKVKDMKATMAHVKTSRVALVRTDNLKLSDRAKNFIKPSK